MQCASFASINVETVQYLTDSLARAQAITIWRQSMAPSSVQRGAVFEAQSQAAQGKTAFLDTEHERKSEVQGIIRIVSSPNG